LFEQKEYLQIKMKFRVHSDELLVPKNQAMSVWIANAQVGHTGNAGVVATLLRPGRPGLLERGNPEMKESTPHGSLTTRGHHEKRRHLSQHQRRRHPKQTASDYKLP
jgi:hypothetical protein